MSKYMLFAAAFAAALSVGVAQAQEATSDQTPSSTSTLSAAPSADASGYGGAHAQSAAGKRANTTDIQQPACVGPVSFCDVFRGGN